MSSSNTPRTPSHWLLHLLLPVLLASLPGRSTAGDSVSASLAERFKDPPGSARILQIIHNFPDDPVARQELVRRFKARGFGGLTVNVSFDEYLKSEAKWQAFEAGVGAARAAGLVVWLYDEQGYPSGAAGGLVLEGRPEWEARGLLAVVRDTVGGEAVEVPLPEGDIVSAAAYPLHGTEGALSEGVDLLAAARATRTLRWDRPGRWRLCALVEAPLREGTHATENLYRKRPCPNLLEAGPVKRFIELTHEGYARRFSPLSDRFEAIFTDEPSLQSVFIRESPHAALPWASGFADTFRRRKGYEVVPRLPALVADFGPEGRRARCDFWDVVGREAAENYFGRIQDWCRVHGIASTGHLLAEEDLGSHIGFYGNFFACASRLDFPGIDCLTSDPATVPWHVAKLIGSIACLLDRPKAMSETSDHAQRYRPPGDKRPPRDVSAAEILGTTHLLYAAGINTTASYYSWAGLDDGSVRGVNEHVGRLAVVLAGAKHACDVAVLYPLESAWARFTPQKVWAAAPGVVKIDAVYRDVSHSLFRACRDFDVIDSASIAKGPSAGGALAIGGERLRVVVLPATDVVPLEALREMAALVRQGGVVVAIGEVPRNTPEAFPSAEAMAVAEEIFGPEALAPDRDLERMRIHRSPSGGAGVYLPERNGWLLPTVLNGLLEPDLQAPEGSPLRYSRWRVEGGRKHAYFVLNDSNAPCDAEVATRGEGRAERWDPATGRIVPLEPAAGGRWPVSLAPYGAAFLVFDGVRGPRPPGEAPASGKVPGLARVEAVHLLDLARPAPRIEMIAAPHVAASVMSLHAAAAAAGTAAGAGAGSATAEAPLPARISARIQTGGVDSWSFAELRFERPLDLSGFRAIELATRVPAGQEGCGARLLVILREEGEGTAPADYLADARRPLGEAGLLRAAVPLDAFRLAGWSRDPDGRLDPARIRAIRAGWGGYIGRMGETVTFDLEDIAFLRVR